jgi:1,4-alpha-glucan branching enzyme
MSNGSIPLNSPIVKEEVMAKKENKSKKRMGPTKTAEIDRKVEFTFHSPEAINVYVAGEFNSWDTQSLPLKRDKDGIWRTKVKLPSGRYEYKLFADNAWVEDLPDSEAVFNPFGTKNFVISVK